MPQRFGTNESGFDIQRISRPRADPGAEDLLPLTVQEEDADPSANEVHTIIVGNDDLTIVSDGIVRINTARDALPGEVSNKIYLWHADGGDVELFDADDVGVIAALAAAESGDTVWVPSIQINLTAGITVPAGVALAGIGRNAQLTFSGFDGAAITLGYYSSIFDLKITLVGNGTDALGVDARAPYAMLMETGVIVSGGSNSNIAVMAGSSTGLADVVDCRGLSASGAGAIGLYVVDNVYASAVFPSGTMDIYLDTGAILYAYAIQYRTLDGPGTLSYMEGDRSPVNHTHGSSVLATVQTTDDTPTLLYTVTPATDSCIYFIGQITARASDGAVMFYQVVFLANNVDDELYFDESTFGTVLPLFEDYELCEVTAAANGSLGVDISVTGIAALTIDWQLHQVSGIVMTGA